MSEANKEPEDRFNIDKFIEKLPQNGPDHETKPGSGILKPDSISNELRNKVARIETEMFIWSSRGVSPELVSNLGRRSISAILAMHDFQDETQKSLLKKLVAEDENLARNLDLFEDKDKPTS